VETTILYILYSYKTEITNCLDRDKNLMAKVILSNVLLDIALRNHNLSLVS